MRTDIRKRYWIAGVALLVASALSLLLRLDPASAGVVLRELRIPRLILALAVGGGLSLSGLVLQTVLANPLAEPYTLGIASGAALGAALALPVARKFSIFGLNGGAVLGAGLVIMLLLRTVARGHRGHESILLLGVMISLISSSLLAIWMALADPLGVQNLNFWMLGDLTRAGLGSAILLLILVGLIGLYFFLFSRKLDAFLFGEDQVESFGVALNRTRGVAIVLVSVLVGLCVSAAGMIGFVGLVVPHWVRRSSGARLHYHLVPLCLIWGGTLLSLSDAISRAASEPRELPVGAVTALIGAPVFILLYLRAKRGGVE